MIFFDFGVKMSLGLNGIGLRAWELAAAFSSHEDVTVLVPDTPHDEVRQAWSGVPWRRVQDRGLPVNLRGDTLVYGFATDPEAVARFRDAGALCVFDALVWPLEYLTYEWLRNESDSSSAYGQLVADYIKRVQLADRFLVGSNVEKQTLIGILAVNDYRRLLDLGVDPSLDDQIHVLPVGFSRSNERRGLASKSMPGMELSRPTFVWNGGLWNHYMPIAAVRGLASLLGAGADADLWFLYPQRGNPTSAYKAARDAAREDQALRGRVRFCEGGMSLAERISVLESAAASICLYRPHALWDLAPPMRSRDAFVYGLPIIAPGRGALGDLITVHGFGTTVDTLHPDSVAEAMHRCLDDHDRDSTMRSAAATASDLYEYERVVPQVYAWLKRNRES